MHVQWLIHILRVRDMQKALLSCVEIGIPIILATYMSAGRIGLGVYMGTGLTENRSARIVNNKRA
jgi:hypothetical protein